MSEQIVEENNEESLWDLKITDLRILAQRTYGIAVTKAMDRESIIKMIENRTNVSNHKFARKGKELQPGWSRIFIEKDDDLSGKYPVYVNCNTYAVVISRGMEVDVPTKIYNVLRNALRQVLIEDEGEAMDSPNRKRLEEVPRIPVRLIAQVEGADPRGDWEKQREAKLRPYRAFFEEMGFWPSAKVMREYVVQGRFNMRSQAVA